MGLSRIFLLLPLLLLITSTQSNPQSNFYLQISSTNTSPHPTCIGVDSAHTYLCTDTPDAARKALGIGNVGGVTAGEKNFVNLGVNQRMSGSETEIQRVREVFMEMIRYMDEEVMNRSEYEHVRGNCRNEHELCAFWTSVGECESNRVFMLQNCAAACRLCLLQVTNMMGA